MPAHTLPGKVFEPVYSGYLVIRESTFWNDKFCVRVYSNIPHMGLFPINKCLPIRPHIFQPINIDSICISLFLLILDPFSCSKKKPQHQAVSPESGSIPSCRIIFSPFVLQDMKHKQVRNNSRP